MKDYVVENFRTPYLYGVRHIAGLNASETTESGYHRSVTLIFIFYKKGKGSLDIEGTSYEINEGDVIILNPSEFFLHNIDNNVFHERIIFYVCHNALSSFPGGCFPAFSMFYKREKGKGNIIPADIVKKHGIDNMFDEILEIKRSNLPTKEPLVMCKMIETMCKMVEVLEDTSITIAAKVAVSTLVDNVLKYVDKNYTKDISVQEIADRFGVHRTHLSAEFNRQIGTPLWKYIILRRIFKFNSLLKGEKSIEEVAYKVGFHNYSNFFRLYKKYMKMTPLEYKKQCDKP